MLGESPDQDVAQARDALGAGDLDTALTAAERARRAWTVAWEEGRRRALLMVAVLVTVLVLGSAVASTRRRSRRPAARGIGKPSSPHVGRAPR
jgi:hypothetical protein